MVLTEALQLGSSGDHGSDSPRPVFFLLQGQPLPRLWARLPERTHFFIQERLCCGDTALALTTRVAGHHTAACSTPHSALLFVPF